MFNNLSYHALWICVHPPESLQSYILFQTTYKPINYSNIHNQVLIVTRKERKMFTFILITISSAPKKCAVFTEHVENCLDLLSKSWEMRGEIFILTCIFILSGSWALPNIKEGVLGLLLLMFYSIRVCCCTWCTPIYMTVLKNSLSDKKPCQQATGYTKSECHFSYETDLTGKSII